MFQGHEGHFLCASREGTTEWRVNDTAIDDLPIEIQDELETDSVTSAGFDFFTLSIPGRVEYNGTTVQCVSNGRNGPGVVESKTAHLTIQGVVSKMLLVCMCNLFIHYIENFIVTRYSRSV